MENNYPGLLAYRRSDGFAIRRNLAGDLQSQPTSLSPVRARRRAVSTDCKSVTSRRWIANTALRDGLRQAIVYSATVE